MSTTVELVRANERYARLRAAVEGLAAEFDKEADAICPRDQYDKADKAWRVAHVRRRAADDLRALLAAVDS